MIESLTDLIAANLTIAAPIVAFLVSWVLYGVLGKRYLGADDDYWPAIRNRLLPLLHRLGMDSGLYAQAQQLDREFVGVVPNLSEETFERELEAAGYYRNPLASVKPSPQGWESDGSWARRYGSIRLFGDLFRIIADHLRSDQYFSHTIPGWIADIIGRFLQAAGDIFARRQVHVTIYTRETVSGQELWLYGHDEPNSLNPFTAWRHYTAKSWDAERGVEKLRTMLKRRGIGYSTIDPTSSESAAGQ